MWCECNDIRYAVLIYSRMHVNEQLGTENLILVYVY
jgi:hypothetical protein